jgi:hypothetical protein
MLPTTIRFLPSCLKTSRLRFILGAAMKIARWWHLWKHTARAGGHSSPPICLEERESSVETVGSISSIQASTIRPGRTQRILCWLKHTIRYSSVFVSYFPIQVFCSPPSDLLSFHISATNRLNRRPVDRAPYSYLLLSCHYHRFAECRVRQIGNHWVEIARRLPGRTENAVKRRWNNHMRRRTLLINDSRSHTRL